MSEPIILPVRTPYRLDLTVDALRRLSTNVVDIVTPEHRYMRALQGLSGTTVVDVRQHHAGELEVRINGGNAQSALTIVRQMLGADIDLREWYERVKSFPWLAHLAGRLQGLKPPRYPELWEAICHGIIFQQLSIVAAAAIMQRLIVEYSAPIERDDVTLYAFPRPQAIVSAPITRLRALGLSHMKASYLKSAAEAVVTGAVRAEYIESLPTPVAATALTKLRGIGPWSAAVILLRGFGRLDTFPLNDSGVLRSIRAISGNERIDIHRVLAALGDMRGMLYFHLLLGRRYLR